MSFTFGHPFCPQCGVDVDPEVEDQDTYCDDCLEMFKSYEAFKADEKSSADMMAEWEAQRYGY